MVVGCNEINRCAIIIQARMSSRRFPKKTISRLAGMPLIEYIYRRCKSSSIGNILVATSHDKSDNELYVYCRDNNIPVMRGSLDNVLERYVLAADSIGADYIARVCGDTPLVDISLMESMLNALIEDKLDYISPDRETCASGFYSEAVALRALKKAAKSTNVKEDLEHVTRFIIENKDEFLTRFIDAELNPESARQTRLTVDFPEDLPMVSSIIGELQDKFAFTSRDVLNILRNRARYLRA
ncbi:MAG: NTP transferase domain-containing protein [Candidatus Omnitrophica bacterium]|nr:NTP transferase domain-containing protein [Syntrophales bacterium]MDD4910390.1 NTP transferase domain-containing protein [Candidatus Omnitrophota bacterium]